MLRMRPGVPGFNCGKVRHEFSELPRPLVSQPKGVFVNLWFWVMSTTSVTTGNFFLRSRVAPLFLDFGLFVRNVRTRFDNVSL